MAVRVRELTEAERTELERRAHARTAPARAVERARLVLAAQAGEHAPAVAGRLGVAAGTVRLWVRRFNAAGGPPAPGVALMSVVIGTLFLHEPRNVKI